jgi:hypothetical protein
LKNSSDLESKAKFLQYLAQNSQDKLHHDFVAQGMALFQETDFENWLMSFDVSLFQNIRKSRNEAVETIYKSSFPSLSKGKGDEIECSKIFYRIR